MTTSTWDTAWTLVNDYFCCLAQELRHDHPGLGWECGHRQSEKVPFQAYACFSRADVGTDDDVLVNLRFRHYGDSLVFSSGISLVAGQEVAVGPGGLGPGRGDPADWVYDRIQAGLQFVGAQLNELNALLC